MRTENDHLISQLRYWVEVFSFYNHHVSAWSRTLEAVRKMRDLCQQILDEEEQQPHE